MVPTELEVAAAVASVVSAATVLAAVVTWLRRLRRIQALVIGSDIVGITEFPGFGGASAYILEVRNSGSGTAHILELQSVGAKFLRTIEHPPRKTLGSGESFTQLVTSPDIAGAWFRVMWREQSDRSKAKVRWYPLDWRQIFALSGNVNARSTSARRTGTISGPTSLLRR